MLTNSIMPNTDGELPNNDGELVHYQLTQAIMTGKLETPEDYNEFEFIPISGEGWSADDIRKSKYHQNKFYNANYEALIKDGRFYFKYNSITGVSVHVREALTMPDDSESSIIECFTGYRGRILSQEEGRADPSCFIVEYSPATSSKFPKKTNQIVYHKLLGSLSFLNHACGDCVNCVPFDLDGEAGVNYRKLSLIGNVPKNKELTIQYVRAERNSDIPFNCITCGRRKK